MPDTIDAAAVLLAAAAPQGLGNPLRIVLLVSIVGGVLLAWFLLRGYRTDDTDPRTGASTGAENGADAGSDSTTDSNTVDNANA